MESLIEKLFPNKRTSQATFLLFPLLPFFPFTMASSLLQIFEQYQKARVQFVQSVAEAATRPRSWCGPPISGSGP